MESPQEASNLLLTFYVPSPESLMTELHDSTVQQLYHGGQGEAAESGKKKSHAEARGLPPRLPDGHEDFTLPQQCKKKSFQGQLSPWL